MGERKALRGGGSKRHRLVHVALPRARRLTSSAPRRGTSSCCAVLCCDSAAPAAEQPQGSGRGSTAQRRGKKRGQTTKAQKHGGRGPSPARGRGDPGGRPGLRRPPVSLTQGGKACKLAVPVGANHTSRAGKWGVLKAGWAAQRGRTDVARRGCPRGGGSFSGAMRCGAPLEGAPTRVLLVLLI